MLKTIFITSTILLFLTGCNQPHEAEKVELNHDIQDLMALNTAYENKEIDAMTYLKKSRVLKQKIKQEEEMLGDGHTHEH